MAELLVGGLSAVLGLVLTIWGIFDAVKDGRAVQAMDPDELDVDPDELWALVLEDLGRQIIVGIGQLLIVTSAVLVLIFPRLSRPDIVREWITWSVVLMPVVLGLLSLHSRRARKRAEKAKKDNSK